MLFFYVRHGDPIYSPDSLTPLGEKQAASLVDRFSRFGLDRIYSSTSYRAMMTARPTADALGKEIVPLAFAEEGKAYREFCVPISEENPKTCWCFQQKEMKRLFCTPEIVALGKKWYDAPAFDGTRFAAGSQRIAKEADEFFASLGYVHDSENNLYRVEKPNDERVAFFAHQGFGMVFLSHLLDIPYPTFCTRFDLCHSSVTVIYFKDLGGYSIPKVLELSNDSHLYRAGLPLAYNNNEALKF